MSSLRVILDPSLEEERVRTFAFKHICMFIPIQYGGHLWEVSTPPPGGARAPLVWTPIVSARFQQGTRDFYSGFPVLVLRRACTSARLRFPFTTSVLRPRPEATAADFRCRLDRHTCVPYARGPCLLDVPRGGGPRSSPLLLGKGRCSSTDGGASWA